MAVWADNGRLTEVPEAKVRALLADLLLHFGRPASADRLIDDLWGDDLPVHPAGALQSKVSRLRQALEKTGRDPATFPTSKRKAGKGRNPRTGEEIKIPATTTVRFKAGKGLKDAVN